MIKFQYGRNGQIYRVLDTFNCLQQPSKPIPAHITAITGITDGEVAGHTIDPSAVKAFVSGAALIIAHNAKFDRPMCEATWPYFHGLNWACSLTQIPWKDEGHEGTKLGYLLKDYGYFHNGHRAIDDCRALLHLLAQPLSRSKRLAMTPLLDNARKTEFQLWAENAPFEFKDVLKGRGYRWDGAARCWSIVLDEGALAAEEEFLLREVCPGRAVPFRRDKITARNRFSLLPG
jgi:DNA polymerase-3 subunit epsilon